LQDYCKKVGSVSLEQSQYIITPRLDDLSKRLVQSKSNLIQAGGSLPGLADMSTNIEDLPACPQVATVRDVVQISIDVMRHENDSVLVRQRYREKKAKYAVAAASPYGLKQQAPTNAPRVRTRIQENIC